MASSKTITLRSSDGEAFDLEEVVAVESQTIKHMIEDGCADNAIPLPNVTSKILAKVIEYCKKHVETPKAEEHAVNDELKAWDADFVKVDQATLFDLILVRLLNLFFFFISRFFFKFFVDSLGKCEKGKEIRYFGFFYFLVTLGLNNYEYWIEKSAGGKRKPCRFWKNREVIEPLFLRYIITLIFFSDS